MSEPSSFVIFPAIDLHAGQVVRLQQGDPARQTAYDAVPAQAAERWLAHGAQWLHVVNLDGAFDQPDLANRRALHSILAAANRRGARVQFGGGIRTLQAVENALSLGVACVVLGTAAVENPRMVSQALERWGVERIAVGLDARDGLVQVRGWQQATPLKALQAASDLRQMGLRRLIFTDIARDGLQAGLNLTATSELAQRTGLDVVASGGVSCAGDVLAARQAGLAGVIVGKALYEGSVQLSQLLDAVGQKGQPC